MLAHLKIYCVNIILIPHFVHGKKQDEDDINSSKRPICKWDIYVRGSTQVVIRSRKGARAEICAAPRNYFGQMYCLPQNHCTHKKSIFDNSCSSKCGKQSFEEEPCNHADSKLSLLGTFQHNIGTNSSFEISVNRNLESTTEEVNFSSSPKMICRHF